MPAMLFILLGLTYFKGAVMEECCLEKEVGEIRYVLVGEENTSAYGCESDCVYEQEGVFKDKFCFKAGHLPVECLVGDGSLQLRKNLNSLTPQEKHDLIYALIAAKKFGSYTGPKISGPDTNSTGFNSSFVAAASMHGYPGLCPSKENIAAQCCWHADSRFLPFHRLLTAQFNYALQFNETYKHVVLPYWDWTHEFNKLPDLFQNLTIINPIPKKTLDNPFFHTWIPGVGFFHNGTPKALINLNKGCADNKTLLDDDVTEFDIKNDKFCANATAGMSLLMNMTLYALSERTYIHFEWQLEQPHNIVHTFLGGSMDDPNYAAFAPIFMIFHAGVDRLWAVFQALQEHRGILYENDCHPYFDKNLPPYSNTNLNTNSATKLHSRANETVNYRKAFGYEYDNLKLMNMTIPELNSYLEGQNDIDRLFAGFSLPDILIPSIKFNVCFPITNCSFYSPLFQVSTVHSNKEPRPVDYKNSELMLVEVTQQLHQFGLNASQDIGFKITSTSPNAKHVTFTPVSVFRKAGTQVDRITVHWLEERGEYNYAPFFKVRPTRTNVMRFLPEDGISVYQYSNENEFNDCDNKTLVEQEIELSDNGTYYFQNPNRTGCNKENKLIVKMPQPCNTSGPAPIHYSILWNKETYRKYSKGICMTHGTFLQLYYAGIKHNVTQLQTKADFDNCTSFTPQETGIQGPIWFPQYGHGLEKNKSYYIVSPVDGQCNAGVKVKICVKDKCSSTETCD